MTKETLIHALGKEIRARRKLKEWTQVDLALRAGIHPNFLSLIERGQTMAGIDSLLELADALGITVSQLLKSAEERIGLR